MPETSERKFTPSSTGLSGPPSTTPGIAIADQIVFVALAIARSNAFVALCAGLAESVTRAVKLKLPVAVGVPEIAPLVGLSVKPGGRVPLTIDQVYDGVPPLAASIAE